MKVVGHEVVGWWGSQNGWIAVDTWAPRSITVSQGREHGPSNAMKKSTGIHEIIFQKKKIKAESNQAYI